MKNINDWNKLKEELIKLDVVSQVDLRFFNCCNYSEYDDNFREWKEDVWIECPLGCLVDRKRINVLLDFSDKNNLDIEIIDGERIRFKEKYLEENKDDN
jgi:hypothetical protein